MSRDLDASVVTALGAAELRVVLFFSAEFPSGTVRLNSTKADIIVGGNTYTGTGGLSAVSETEETIDDATGDARFTLTGAAAGIALALGDNPRGVKVVSMFGFLNSGGTLIADPTIDFSGRGSHFLVDPGAEISSITLVAYDETGDQERPLEERLTDNEQQRMHPGDIGLQYVASLPNQKFTWGNANVVTAQASNGPAGYMPGDGDSVEYVP